MLVRAEVINDAAALWAVNHVGIEAPRMAGLEISNPCNCFSTERVNVREVSDGKGDCGPALRKHDPSPASYIEEGQREELAAPNLVHCAPTDRCAPVLTAETESFLHTRMQEFELLAERLLVDRSHLDWSGVRRQCAALGRSRPVMIAMAAKAATARFNVSGLNAARR